MRRAKAKRVKPAPTTKPLGYEDVRMLAHFMQQARPYAEGLRTELVELLAALQGDRHDDEMILKALSRLAGCIEATLAEFSGADAELTKLMVRVKSIEVAS